jgi:aryl-alcohol dehydrogenase-like predicted oxidoreductase
MKTTTLGKSGLHVSRIAFGTWQLGGDWGSFDEDAAIATIRRAVDLGINLAALDVDYIDLYQVHWPDSTVPFSETAGALADLVAQGKIRHVGVSNFDAAQMEEFSPTLPVETVQPPYHLFRLDIEDELLPYCSAQDIGVLVYGPLAHGLLTGTLRPNATFQHSDWRSKSSVFRGDAYRRNLAVVGELALFATHLGITVSQLAIAWALSHRAVHVAIVGARRVSHLEDSAGAVDTR